MKKKAVVGILVCLFALGALVGSVQAAWYTVNVTSVGCTGSLIWMIATDLGNSVTGASAFTNQIFQFQSTNPKLKEMYAAALTAKANSSSASINLSTTGPWSVIQGCGVGPFNPPF